MYAFSRNEAGALDKTATIYPAIAWWDGHYELKQSDKMFQRWDSSEFSTDWGLRDVGEHEAIYDPLSYHQGPVWPLFTGWGSIAEYRTGRSLSGYAHLMQNAELTWQQDLGAVTELLSGATLSRSAAVRRTRCGLQRWSLRESISSGIIWYQLRRRTQHTCRQSASAGRVERRYDS